MSAQVEEREPEVSLDGPLGIRVGVKGQNLVAVFLGVVFVIAFFGIIWWHNTDTDDRLTRLAVKLDELVFVTTLSPEERKALNLNMPDSLRAKQRHWRRDEQP